MRPTHAIALALACCCPPALTWAQTATPPAQPEAVELLRIGTVKQVQGQASLTKGKQQRAAAPGQAVWLGEVLATGPASAISVTLRDGTVLTLGPDSEADMSEYAFNATTQEGSLLVKMVQGSMRVVTGLLAKVNPDLFRISTPTSVVGVRGTDFIVEVVPEPPRWNPAAGEFNHGWKL